mmetsp:Transcript_19841/g.45059  ORF Transcript_19841/g.45059 Transcript_19841/m.45059 type:complete len:144 (-) Transcript_19841:8-439(-)
MEGQGEFRDVAGGGIYAGTFICGRKDGRGKEIWTAPTDGKKKHFYDLLIGWRHSSWCSYEGEYKCGLPHGKGKFIAGDGRSYEGGWARGKREGFGNTVLIPTGNQSIYRALRCSGEYRNGRLEKACSICYPDGKGREIESLED